MNTSIADRPHTERVPCDSLQGFSQELANLSQQDVENGLDLLYLALFRKRLPFIVLVEDDDYDADLFRLALEAVGTGVQLMHFRNGQKAIDFFNGKGCYHDREKFPLPELTVLDVGLTEMSGLDVLQEIRSKLLSEQLVVVALTSSEDAEEIEQAHSLKINEWLNKPENIMDLVEIVRRLVRTWLPSSA